MIVIVLVLFWIYTEEHCRVVLSMAPFSGHLNRVWLRRSKIEDEDEFEDEDDKGRRTSERSRGASGSIRMSARDGDFERCSNWAKLSTQARQGLFVAVGSLYVLRAEFAMDRFWSG